MSTQILEKLVRAQRECRDSAALSRRHSDMRLSFGTVRGNGRGARGALRLAALAALIAVSTFELVVVLGGSVLKANERGHPSATISSSRHPQRTGRRTLTTGGSDRTLLASRAQIRVTARVLRNTSEGAHFYVVAASDDPDAFNNCVASARLTHHDLSPDPGVLEQVAFGKEQVRVPWKLRSPSHHLMAAKELYLVMNQDLACAVVFDPHFAYAAVAATNATTGSEDKVVANPEMRCVVGSERNSVVDNCCALHVDFLESFCHRPVGAAQLHHQEAQTTQKMQAALAALEGRNAELERRNAELERQATQAAQTTQKTQTNGSLAQQEKPLEPIECRCPEGWFFHLHKDQGGTKSTRTCDPENGNDFSLYNVSRPKPDTGRCQAGQCCKLRSMRTIRRVNPAGPAYGVILLEVGRHFDFTPLLVRRSSLLSWLSLYNLHTNIPR